MQYWLRSRPLALSLVLATSIAPFCAMRGQAPAPGSGRVLKTFQLRYVASPSEGVDLSNALRNVVDPNDHIYLHVDTNTLIVSAQPGEMDEIASLIAQLDQPKKTYRLTYTVNVSENGNRVGVQHFSFTAVTGLRAQLKEGDKIPVLTGSYNADKNSQQNQFTYLDIGMNIDVNLDPFGNGLRLRSRFEQSALAPETHSPSGVDDPVLRQSLLEQTTFIVPGKPTILGGIDVPGSNRHVDIEVVVEPIA